MTWLLPPILVLILLILMAVLARLWPEPGLLSDPWHLLGLVLLLAGIALPLMVSRLFRRVRTNINTFRDPDVMVADGPFRISRNPIYLGFALILLGAALLSGAAVALLPALAFVLITDRWYIPFEEARMSAQFGAAYDDYRRRTRRWL
ncbi:methyltransferase [Tistrella mobilis]|uniref:methyltransferase family protein n=1 Tax=Tistrella mobilis TaxID=171437 RepID=UPI0035580943